MRLRALAFIGLTACHRDAGVQDASPPASTPMAPPTPMIAQASSAPAAPQNTRGAASTEGRAESASDARNLGQPNCRFEGPWTPDRADWLGSCRGGFADGIGVIVVREDGGDSAPTGIRFYGRLQNGYWKLGVLESGGYRAGTWEHGEVVPQPDDEPNASLRAFDEASAAARAVSKSFAQKGDRKASRFYADQARKLFDALRD